MLSVSVLALEKRYAELQDADGLNAPKVTVANLANATSATFAETLMPKAKLTKLHEKWLNGWSWIEQLP